jgi:hypothetical protein
MTPAHVTRGQRRYRYYTCSAAQRKGWHTCPSKSVPALALERFVLEQIAAHARHVAWPSLAPAEQARGAGRPTCPLYRRSNVSRSVRGDAVETSSVG